MATHDKQFHVALPCTKLNEAKIEALKYDCIGIDEGQFFPDIVDFCEEMANLGKTVIVAALDGNFERKPFGKILDLIPKSEEVMKLTAVCIQCGTKASFSSKISGSREVEIDIGGSDKYIATCRACYHEK
jgi:thymidine kinase